MELAFVKEHIAQNYNIGPIAAVGEILHGSGNAFDVDTESERYIAKFNERLDFVLLYDKVEPILTGFGHCQAKIIRTVKNEPMTPRNAVLYSFLHGEAYETLNTSQMGNAVKYLRRYNLDLAKVPFVPSEIRTLSSWDKAKSLDYLVNEFDGRRFPIERSDVAMIDKAIRVLKNDMDTVLDAPKQLVHSDLGPDNILFRKDDVYAIIDFTPEYENELYSLCQFYYWNCCWPSTEGRHPADELLKIYYQRDASSAEKECFHLFMIKAALFRVAGPLMAGKTNLEKRFDILRRVIETV